MSGEAPGTESMFPPWGKVAASVVRSVLSVAVLLTLYSVLPLAAAPIAVAVALLVVGLLALAAIVVWQFLAISGAQHPGLRAAEALAIAVTLFIVLFAATYLRWSEGTPGAFSEHLSRVDALYFTVTVFATVGFGDITALSPGARIVVTLQMVGDLLLLGLVVNAMLTTARRARAARQG
ncbi:potassium channel family protein [Actinomycetospora sp. TBRC 11914]|uniref:potassium channel family protein n=1 Tax=Actinomycetospora sp. TBRC 11914 TaxID=2729387 RepID=UPI00145EBEEF|nr:potassium channel family protein [Actinomycetospora sp. TBRC 11914]NMO93754.1 two pore domain potassium channel family protein [Actinomycetospora sp. TBRC 11914]